MENKMTAVQWLENILHDFIHPEHGAEFFPFVEQAKAMEKEQMVRAFYAGCSGDYSIEEVREWAENYISSTYNKSKTPPGAHCEEA